jgi:hypothetical protein
MKLNSVQVERTLRQFDARRRTCQGRRARFEQVVELRNHGMIVGNGAGFALTSLLGLSSICAGVFSEFVETAQARASRRS